MGRTLSFWCFVGVFALAPCCRVSAELSDEQKQQLFLKAREDIHPVPRASASATPRPKPRPVSTPESTPEPTPKPTPESTPHATPDPAPARTHHAEEEEKPVAKPEKHVEKPAEKAEEKPADKTPEKAESEPASTPEAKPDPAQVPQGHTPNGAQLNAPISIEKSGLEEDQGYEPAPVSNGGWFRRWKYLTPAVRRAIDQARVQKGRWKYIIVHNSGTRQGNAHIFDVYHRRVRKMVNGLAYHFVIGNGSSSGNGEIEIGNRWTVQLNGGHVASDYLNNIALGVCLVGDFNRDQPTTAQLAALDELISYLRGRVGKIKGKPAIVLPHKIINPKPTDCPGDRFPYHWLQQRFGQ